MRALAFLALLSVGCGGGTASGTRDDFLGTWTASGSVVFTLSGGSPQSQPVNGSVTIVAGEGASGIRYTDPNGCALNATVNGTLATTTPNSSCSANTALGPVTLTVNNGTLSRSGSFISANSAGTFQSSNSGFSGSGTFQLSANMNKQ